MKIVLYSKNDFNFAAKLTKICDLSLDTIIFLDKYETLKKYKGHKNLIILIDFLDLNNNFESSIKKIKKISNFTTCLLFDKIESKIHKKATNLGYDIIISKSNYLMNYKIIKEQLEV